MGTINYGTSDYITIGYNCNDIDYEDEFYNDIIQDCYDLAVSKLKEESFYYFHVKVEPGYYEGFYIDIEFNFPVCFDSWEDKKLAQKEITRLKAFLIDCVENCECCAVYPGWCNGYADYKKTLEEIDAAIKEMRETVKQTPTYNQYYKKGA